MMPTSFVIPATVPAWGSLDALGPIVGLVGALAVVATFVVLLLGIVTERRDRTDFARLTRPVGDGRRQPALLRRAA